MIYLLAVKNCFYKAAILLGLTFIGRYCSGQDIGNNLVFKHISQKPGLPDKSINFIFQDSSGFIWLATNHGLSRYDGRSFKNYSTIGKNGITDLAVNCIAEDKEGNIWFGTESGLNKLDPFTEKIIQYHEGTGPGTIPYRWCNYLYTDAEKNLWLSSERGLALYDALSNSFRNYPITVFGKDDRINKFINKILDDGAGKLWLSTSFGVKAFDKRSKTYTSYLQENVFYSLFKDHNGSIWAGTFGGDIFLFNNEKRSFDKIDYANKKRLAINDISEIKVQDNWHLLLATNDGLVTFKAGNKLDNPVSVSLMGYGLAKIFTDRQLNLWVTSVEGLFKLNSNSFAFKWLTLLSKSKEARRIFHIIPDIKEPGIIFYLTTQGGWYKYNAVTQAIVPHILPGDKNQLLKNINFTVSDGKGYWFTSVRGFGYYDIYNNRLLDLSQLVHRVSGQDITGFIVSTTEKKYWVTLKRSGILVYDPITGKDSVIFGDKTRRDNTYGMAINDMQKGADGNIWFTSGNKLYRVNSKDFSYKIFSPPQSDEKVAETKTSPLSILFTAGGRMLVSSHLRIYEFKKEKLITIYPVKGFSSFSVERISEDSKNNLWVHAAEGVFKTDSSFSRWEAMNNLPGWEEGTTATEIYTGRPGEILFASDEKIGLLKESLLQKSKTPLPVIISRIRYGENEKYLVSAQNTAIKNSYKDAVEIELSPVNFVDESENKIMYQLNGWDNEWKELIGTSVVRYEQLPPGDYIFVTKSVNAAGIASADTKIAFNVMTPFYRSWWFIVLVIILVAAAAFLFYRFRLRKALELERLRTRIATDLHDDIGATLSSISLYSEVIKNQLKDKNPQLENVLDKMGENSREMVTSMSDIVWAINPGNDDGEKLIKRMENYCTDMCAVKSILLQYKADEKLNQVLLPLEHRKNIYLIFKEAINNAVKYSGATTIWVNIEILNRKLLLTIKDDGKGFDAATVVKGNGLKNMHFRTAEINGTITIDSVEGGGTTVSLQCIV